MRAELFAIIVKLSFEITSSGVACNGWLRSDNQDTFRHKGHRFYASDSNMYLIIILLRGMYSEYVKTFGTL